MKPLDYDAMQAALDAHAYPPTHTYDIRTLTPTGILAQRVERILGLFPGFFEAECFMDVGANKGFFSLRAARESAHVVALDPNPDVLAIWYPAAPSHVMQQASPFSAAQIRADVVWIGNGPHYLNRYDRAWMDTLDRVATDHVVMEGPTGRECRDVSDREAWPHVLEEQDLVAGMKAHGFTLVGSVTSPDYTPDRKVWHFQRG